MTINEKIGVAIPEIWMPAKGVNLTRWAVIACDQYTSQPDYWQAVEETVGDAPSALRLMLPEVYLPATDEKLSRIDGCMAEYMANGTLESRGEYVTYIERGCSNGKVRHGWLVAVDLEKYEFDAAKKAMIRASEATVISRIPPRVKIRASARMEMPHVMLLVDDPEYKLDAVTAAGSKEIIYDLDLMAKGGHITGYRLSDGTAESLINAMETLVSPDGMLFAVGDGNHSLAAAKTLWEQLKAEGAGPDHPARFALVEIVNIHDNALEFEPIYRSICEADFGQLFDAMTAFFAEQGVNVLPEGDEPAFAFYYDGQEINVYLDAKFPMAIAPIQQFLDRYAETADIELDYIHGALDLKSVCDRQNAIGILLNPIDKAGVMRSVSENGALPRKAFSMGESTDKRYYMECRVIRQP